ncbi:uncharacterized protein LOC113767338 isoform X1 [Coffea eugenioides]|uniref:Uncharacterized protein LOC113742921 isoform X1 n=1 Tax=Coffea arabica TaxID=13443 RepID=A0A6P6XG51_COFAR|nr:uncharacterized protein LOC113742921 isoform X1 [Coffea arabica]XP_027167194.1 uncharacterized protein LOC113767338 isoform X1 [Coffea eugenioides]XP_027167195.1 uncharacterized protein LOC113767338 isoform X1 [Coffea eugenioides]
MGFDKPNDEQYPPMPLQGDGGCMFASREGGTVDCGQNFPSCTSSADFSFPYVSLANSAWNDMHATHHSYPHDLRNGSHLMTGLMGLDNLQSQDNLNLHSLRGSLRNVDVQNTQANINFLPTGSKAAGDYQMNVLGGEAEGSTVNWSQISESSLNLGCGASLSHQNTSFLEAGVRNDVKVNAFHPRQVDGSFLTLGIGGNPETRAKSKFDSREVANKLVEAVGPQSSSSQIQPATSLSSFQTYPGCSPSTVYKLGDWTTSKNVDAIVGMRSSPFISPQMPEAFKQYDFFENNAKNTSFVDESMGRNSALESYKFFQGDPSPSSLPFNSTYACVPQPGYTKQSELGSEAFESTWVSTQPARDLLWNSHSIEPGNISSSFGSHCSSLRDVSLPQDYLGISVLPSEGCAAQAVGSGDQCASGQPDGHVSSPYKVNSAPHFRSTNYPKNTSLLIAEGSANKPAIRAPFPRRLGVQIDDPAATQSATGSVLSENMGAQTRSNEHQSRISGPVQLAKNFLGPISGHRQDRLAAKFNVQSPSLSTGQPQRAVPVRFPKDLMRVDHTTGQVVPQKIGRTSHVHGVIGQPSLKRRANETPSVPSWGQRRRFFTPSYHSAMSTPAIPPLPSTSAHIKWTDSESPPRPTGHRCMLCKRDLSFRPEGPIYQPINPPAIAVLPCGHTFHDQCLQNITPEDQSKDPPCIPCAIGEKQA